MLNCIFAGGVTSMNEFLLKFFHSVYEQKHSAQESDYCKYDSQILQFFSSSLYIAGLLTGFASSWLATKYGRNRSMLFGGISFLIGGLLNGFAQNIAMLIIGRLLLGVGVGFSTQVTYAFLIFLILIVFNFMYSFNKLQKLNFVCLFAVCSHVFV